MQLTKINRTADMDVIPMLTIISVILLMVLLFRIIAIKYWIGNVSATVLSLRIIIYYPSYCQDNSRPDSPSVLCDRCISNKTISGLQ